MDVRVDGRRLLSDLRELSGFGATWPGVHRLSLSSVDVAARQWLQKKMDDAGLDAQIDGVGNVYGCMPQATRTVLVGSHTDTVPQGGWLDGALGVIYGLEIARVLTCTDKYPGVGVDVISFVDEEATFTPCLGSRSFFGVISPEDHENIVSQEGTPFLQALQESGFGGNALAHFDEYRHFASLECHIEQGPRLEANGKQIGAVTGIVGVRNRRVEFQGRADHAGGTPMSFRRDAGSALIRFANDILSRFERHASEDTVWNIGKVSFEPGRASTVPERAGLQLQYRDKNPGMLARLDDIFFDCLKRAAQMGRVTVSETNTYSQDPVEMDPAIVTAVEAAAMRCCTPFIRLASGAYHDSQIAAAHLPTGMIFIPSIDGRSHAPDENASDEDIVTGAEVALEVVKELLKQKIQAE